MYLTVGMVIAVYFAAESTCDARTFMLIFIGVGARYVPLENIQINFLVGFQMSYVYAN